jgi:hypothetical protein
VLSGLPGRPPLPPHRLPPLRDASGGLPLPDCDPRPVQTRLFSHALVENDLGGCVDCGQPATKLLVGGAAQPDTSLCEACEYRRYLATTGGRDLANEERARWSQPPIPRSELR